jgi:hypothetical protein
MTTTTTSEHEHRPGRTIDTGNGPHIAQCTCGVPAAWLDIFYPPDGATAIRWTDTDWVECLSVVQTHGTFGPGWWLTGPEYTGDAETCACDAHAEWRRQMSAP